MKGLLCPQPSIANSAEILFFIATEIDTQGELFFSLFGALAQYERSLTQERVNAGLAAARRRGRKGGRSLAIDSEKMEQILAALNAGTSKASVCRSFNIPRSTLIDTLSRVGWNGAITQA
nr:recombinase family protein [Brucella pituitosa]